MKKNRLILWIFLLMYYPQIGHSQKSKISGISDSLDELFIAIEKLATKYDTIMFNDVEPDINLLSSIFPINITDDKRGYFTQANLLKAKSDSLSHLTALKLNLSIYENINTPIFDDEGAFIQRRASLGLDWQIFKNGILEKKLDLQLEKNKYKLLQLKKELLIKNDHLDNWKKQVIYNFGLNKLYLLRRQSEFYEEYLKIIKDIYLKQLVRFSELIELKSKLEQTKDKIEQLNDKIDDLKQFGLVKEWKISPLQMPLFELKENKIINGFRNYLNIIENETDYHKTLKNIYSPIRNISFHPYIRFHLMDSFLETSRHYFTAGMQFSFPLQFIHKNRLQIAHKQLNAYNQKMDNEANIRNLYFLMEKYNDLIQHYNNVNTNHVIQAEELRRYQVHRRLDKTKINELDYLNHIDKLIDIELELLQSKENLYLQLVEVYAYVASSEWSDIFKNQEIKHPLKKYSGDRSIYIWSKTFNQVSNEYLNQYLIANEIEKIYLSFSMHIDTTKLTNLFQMNPSYKIYALLGQPKDVYPDNRYNLLIKLQTLNKYPYDGIHLDIEPHTLKNWSSDKEKLLDWYITTINTIKKSVNGINLEVAIPMHYPEDILIQLDKFVDGVNVMAYETNSISSIVRRTEEESNVFKDKLTYAFRTKDFIDRTEIERFIDEFIQQGRGRKIAIHDFKGLEQLDESFLKSIDK